MANEENYQFAMEAFEVLMEGNVDWDVFDIDNLYLTISPDTPIHDMEEYLECFDANQPAIITIYVDQPKPNENKPYNIRDRTVGHTFVGISQGSNTSIFGFYPENSAKPTSPQDTAIMGDNSDTPYDVSISITISPSQLEVILDMSVNYEDIYNLNNYNCTDFAIDIGNEAGLNFSDAYNTWPVGGGSNPGTLGQEIREDYTNNPNVTVDHNGGQSPSNNKDC